MVGIGDTPRVIYSKEVEVIQVVRAVEGHTGDSLYQVQFGESVEVDEELRKYIPSVPLSKPQKRIYPNIVTLYIKTEQPLPYRVGSKWRVLVAQDGKMTLEASGA
ncbi:MAG: hypothetical protein QW688_08545 [Thermoprotei archaeon]